MSRVDRVPVTEFRPTDLDPPISVHLPADRQDWVVTAASGKDMKDREGTEVHRFRHWASPDFYVRIEKP